MGRIQKTYLVIAPTPFFSSRGCHFRIRGEAEALKKLGHKVNIVTYKEGGDIAGLNIQRSKLNISFGSGPAASWKKIPADIALLYNIIKTAFKTKPDIFYCHLHEGVLLGFFARLIYMLFHPFSNTILVLDSQGSLSEELRSYKMAGKLSFKFWKAVEKAIEKLPNVIFTSSLRPDLHEQKLHHIPDSVSLFGLDRKKIDQIKRDKKKCLKQLSSQFSSEEREMIKDWIKNKTIIIFTGGFSKSKGLPQFLIKTFPILAQDNDIRFLLGGGTTDDIIGFGQKNKVITLPDLNIDSLPYFLALGDIALDPKPPSSTESSGKIINYMALGLPVVCFRSKNNYFFLEEGGLYASSYNQFAKLALGLSKNSVRREKMGDRNLEQAWDRFSWKRGVKMIDRVLKSKLE